ncbi:hypothetical protein GCM10011512_26040 [Tersicoccus solisilvae]|uniref:Haloacid dehalogenase n=1 Tax=Tersicoccus solisilvae TaxID=1882339 RepID=A0ABQ1PIJ5_9MICC|nr:HAD family hydrolase [Tersicoccus solisilvae]GGC97876.1 hypothetical protein GCM10011512_26040 [Tersicoccus solisilvae]
MAEQQRILITDLDNTLWDWFDAWYQSFSALLDGLQAISGLDRELLEIQIREVHQRRGTTEYSNLVREVPALVEFSGTRDPFEVFDDALHAQSSARRRETKLYPGVREVLDQLKARGIRVVAYTESTAYWTEWRIKHTGLDGVIDVLYSSPDHDLLSGIDPAALRTGRYRGQFGLRSTIHRQVPLGILKPDTHVISSILQEEEVPRSNALYLGDSLMKDIAMAQAAEVLDVYAEYGRVQDQEEYDLLRRVTHWSQKDVERERALAGPRADVIPTATCHETINEILPIFGSSFAGLR